MGERRSHPLASLTPSNYADFYEFTINQWARRSVFMQECRLAILVNGGVKSEAKWVTTHLAHYPWEWGERLLWRLIVLWPLLFQQRPTVECFYPRRGCRAGQLLSHWTMAMLITEGLRGQRPKPTRPDSLLPRHSDFYFSLLQTVGMFVPPSALLWPSETELKTTAEGLKGLTTVTRILRKRIREMW